MCRGGTKSNLQTETVIMPAVASYHEKVEDISLIVILSMNAEDMVRDGKFFQTICNCCLSMICTPPNSVVILPPAKQSYNTCKTSLYFLLC